MRTSGSFLSRFSPFLRLHTPFSLPKFMRGQGWFLSPGPFSLPRPAVASPHPDVHYRQSTLPQKARKGPDFRRPPFFLPPGQLDAPAPVNPILALSDLRLLCGQSTACPDAAVQPEKDILDVPYQNSLECSSKPGFANCLSPVIINLGVSCHLMQDQLWERENARRS